MKMNGTSTLPHKRQQFSFEKKLQILRAVDSGKSQKEVATEFGISKSTLWTFLKDRNKIEENSRKLSLGLNRKRMRTAKFEDLDKAVFIWFTDVRARNIPVNGPLIQEKAKEVAKLLGHDNFMASVGWLNRFRERYRISARGVFDEDQPNAEPNFDFIEASEHFLANNHHVELNNVNPKMEPIETNNSRPPERVSFSEAYNGFQLVKNYLSDIPNDDIYRSLKIIEDVFLKTLENHLYNQNI